VADKLHSAAIHLLRGLRRVDAASGLTAARMSALSVVVFGGPVTLGQLAEAEQVSPPTMTRLVRAMEADGLIRRHADDNDGRVVWIAATAKGRRLLQEGRQRRIAMLARELDTLDRKQLDLLQEATALIVQTSASISQRGG
jgi:DNA-binding MarR family transcriptional regulator